ncbi:MAG: hypothetical protein PHI18_01260 [bacterium]|nr:hypothetical protein [bacterium]
MAERGYICDVCGKRFRVNAAAEDSEREITCPRCRVPFVRPVGKRRGRVGCKQPTPPSRNIPRCVAFS